MGPLLQDKVVQTGTPSTDETCDADNSHATRGKESDITIDREPPRSSPVTGSAATPPDHEGDLTYVY